MLKFLGYIFDLGCENNPDPFLVAHLSSCGCVYEEGTLQAGMVWFSEGLGRKQKCPKLFSCAVCSHCHLLELDVCSPQSQAGLPKPSWMSLNHSQRAAARDHPIPSAAFSSSNPLMSFAEFNSLIIVLKSLYKLHDTLKRSKPAFSVTFYGVAAKTICQGIWNF